MPDMLRGATLLGFGFNEAGAPEMDYLSTYVSVYIYIYTIYIY